MKLQWSRPPAKPRLCAGSARLPARTRSQMEWPERATAARADSSSHLASRIGVQRTVPAIEPKQQREPNGNLRRCGRKNEQEHHLAIRLAPARARRHKGHACPVQHDLNRYQDKKQIAAHQQPQQTERKNNPAKDQSVAHGQLRHGRDYILPRWHAPTSPPSSSMDASSTPMKYGP